MEYVDGAYTYITKPTETTRNAETKISASKTEISVNENTLALLQSTDMFGRVLQKAVTTGNAETAQENTDPFAAVVTDYGYEVADGTAKSRVATLTNRVTYGTAMTAENAVANYGLAYEYDANGNITAEYAVNADHSHTLRYHYTYDEANQLIRVDDNVRGKTHTYQYNKGGNRVSEKIYNYTLSSSLGTMQKEIKSAYNYQVWDDRLSSYDGKTITYDAAGNPIKYGDITYVWVGKQLVEIRPGNGTKTQFDYDANGLRTQKRQYDTDGKLEYSVDYVWQNGKLTQQILKLTGHNSNGGLFKIGPISTKFVYDGSSDQPVACFVGETQMLFVRNLQGDIIAVATSDGEVVAEFSYDAWGNVEYAAPDGADEDVQSMVALVALICPLTYRGYNYDFTTGLYYLQSRYYNPEWGRFMNVDDTSILLATQGTSHGANLFAYCENNPVNMVDYTGYFSKENHQIITEFFGDIFKDRYFKKLCNGSVDVDKRYSPLAITSDYYQSFHFNVNRSGSIDSRFERFEEMLIKGESYLKKAVEHKQKYLNATSKVVKAYEKQCMIDDLEEAFYYFGFALHPLQDYIAHSGEQGQKIGYIYLATDHSTKLWFENDVMPVDYVATVKIFYHHLPYNAIVDSLSDTYYKTGRMKGEEAKKITAFGIAIIVLLIYDYKLDNEVIMQQ
ncbi:MAG: RHS repeat-associated core domain-containing protein [Candidatus Fimenecus sp.]